MRIESKKLRKLRDSRKLTQQEVSDRLGISQPAYCEWEKQDSDIKLENIIKLSEIFDVELNELAPETTTFKIFHNNNHKEQNNSFIGFEVNVDNIYNDLVVSLKNQIELLEEKIRNLEQNKL
jgi:transcriptional regulator with XRE-family HTH domain